MEKEYNSGPLAKILKLTRSFKNDGWFNSLTGLGLAAKDKRVGMNIQWERLAETEVETLYAQDDIAGKVVDIIPNEGTRAGIELKAEDPNVVAGIKDEKDRLMVNHKFERAWRWARLYGGAALFIALDDGIEDLKEPLNLERIRTVKSLTLLNRWELIPDQISKGISSPNFGMPETYQISPRTSSQEDAGSIFVHHTRLIRFDGVELPRILHESNEYWGDSVLTRMFNVLRNFNLAHDSTASVLQDFRIGVLRLKNLADMVAGDDSNALKKRIELMNLAKSVMNSVVLDAEDEDFTNLQTNLSGIKETLEAVNNRLVAATRMPHTIILGEGSTGNLSGAGDSEKEQLNDLVSAEQERVLTPAIDRAHELIMAQKMGPTRGKQVALVWGFNPLTQLDSQEQSELHFKQAQADALYIDRGVLGPDEVAQSRFGGDEFSVDTKIDTDARAQQKQARNEPITDDTHEHVHFDPMGGISSPPIVSDDGLDHTHTRPNGELTGKAVGDPRAEHIHETPDGLTGDALNLDFPMDAKHPPKPKKKRRKKEDEIAKQGNEWCVRSKDGTRNFGCYKTRQEAEDRLRQVEFFKRR